MCQGSQKAYDDKLVMGKEWRHCKPFKDVLTP